MKKLFLILCGVFVQMSLSAQQYFPEGTKWTEIRLDTLKHGCWYSKVGEEWVPNFEKVEYQVKGEYKKSIGDGITVFRNVYTSGPEWTDSLTLIIGETADGSVEISIPISNEIEALSPTLAYQFNWEVGNTLYCQDLEGANETCLPPCGIYEFGTIDEIKEQKFGGEKTLKYVDLNGKRIIQGIGVIEWNSGECLFGPVNPYFARCFFNEYNVEDRHYRSILVHFERNGEVLFDLWPQTNGVLSPLNNANFSDEESIYDLSGRRLSEKPQRGIYIQDGKKRKQR